MGVERERPLGQLLIGCSHCSSYEDGDGVCNSEMPENIKE